MAGLNPILVVLGPTASGKTQLAVKLADALAGEIISADSRQIFKGMDIGTGKDLGEYLINGRKIPYHLIDIRAAGMRYNVNEFKEDFYTIFNELNARAVLPILCGGTGMYINSILQNHEYTAIPVNTSIRDELKIFSIDALRTKLKHYPAELTAHADQSSHKRMIRAIEIAEYLLHHELVIAERPVVDPFIIGLTSDVTLRRSKVADRLEQRFNKGMIEEVKQLITAGVDKDTLIFYGLEYKFIVAYLDNEISYSVLKEKLTIAICQYAKRQMTFFRKMEKDGVKIHWLDNRVSADELFVNAMALYTGVYR